MEKIKLALQGYKTYFLMASAIIATIVAWSAGEMGLIQAVQSIIAALGLMTVRAGVDTAVEKKK